MEVKQGYKQTEVGVIPDGWEVKRLSEIGEPLIGLTYKPSDVRSDGLLVLRSSNVSDGVLQFDDNVFVDMDVPERIIVRKGDILICVRNGSRDLIGKCAQIDERAEGMTFGAFMAVFRTPFHGFVYHQFQSSLIKRQINEHLGATINQITNKSLNSFQVPFPKDEAEQRAISTALSDVDRLISALNLLIVKKRDLKRAAMQQLLTGQTRLPGFSGEWKTTLLGNESTLITKGTTPTSLGRNFKKQGINFVKIESLTEDGNVIPEMIAAIDEDTHRLLKRSQLRENDVLFSIAGALGRTAIVNADLLPANTNQALAIIRLKPYALLLHGFLLKYLAGPQIRAHITAINVQAAQANLSLEDIRNFEVPVPSIDEQTAIAAVLSDMDAEIAVLEARRDKTRALKQGMMQELLTGRTRLV